nr:flagellar biosynthesis anti-sigma factor FlgM [Pseudoflavonifractor sp. 524-17]
MTSSGYGAISPIAPKKVYRAGKERGALAQTASSHSKYDCVTLSSVPTGESRFHMDMVSRLSQEVRTATTTGDIQALRQAVASGAYKPDPMAIAARILFLGEEG